MVRRKRRKERERENGGIRDKGGSHVDGKEGGRSEKKKEKGYLSQ